MKVALIGGTGFVGSYLVAELVQRGHQPVLLVRPGSESKVVQQEKCILVSGDVKDRQAVHKSMAGCEAVIYCVGILREFKDQGITFEELHFQGSVRTIDTARELGVKRFILMSANGVKADGTVYQTTKYRAEQYLKQSDLNWTIFRPSVIFGDPKGKMEFCTQLYEQMIKPPIPAPLFYQGLFPIHAGSFVLTPIHIEDVATVFVKSLTMPETFHQTYGLCGPDVVDWKSIIRLLARVTGRSKLMVPAPAWVVRAIAVLLEEFAFFPISRDQITMLLEGNTCDSSEVFKLFGLSPRRFDETSLAYLRQSSGSN
jgi:NADH dehydrogenase